MDGPPCCMMEENKSTGIRFGGLSGAFWKSNLGVDLYTVYCGFYKARGKIFCWF